MQCPEIMCMVDLCLSVRNMVSEAQSTVQLRAQSSSGGFVTFVGANIHNSFT